MIAGTTLAFALEAHPAPPTNPSRNLAPVRHTKISPASVGMSLYGLQRMESRHREVQEFLMVLGDGIYPKDTAKHRPDPPRGIEAGEKSDHLSPQHISNAVYGLQNMNTDDEAVRHVLHRLALRCQESEALLDPQGISTAVYGLQQCDGNLVEVQRMLAQITAKIQPGAVLTSQGVGNTLLGLKRMGCDSEAVQDFLAALAPIIERSPELLGGQEFATAIYGLQGMRSDVPEVADVLRTIPPLVTDRAMLSQQGVAMVLYGMQNMQSSHPEVRNILALLEPRIRACQERPFRSQVRSPPAHVPFPN